MISRKATTAGPRTAQNSFAKRFGRQKYIFAMLIIGLAWYIIFKYSPLWFVSNAFTNFGTVANPRFVGFDNFRRLFGSPLFTRAFFNTLILSALNLIFYFPIPIIIALSLNELSNKFFQRSAQFIVYAPYFLSWVVVGGLFNLMLSPSDGIVNQALVAVGVIDEPIFFMASSDWFRAVLIGTEIWKNAGYGAVIYIAAIASVDRELYHAAAVDGAGRWAQMFHVTLPGIRGTIATVLFLTVARILQMFEQILVMSNAAVMNVADVLRTFSFNEGLMRGNIGYATSIDLFTSVVSVILIIGCNQFSKRVLKEEII